MATYDYEQFAAVRIYTNQLAYSPDSTTLAHVVNTTGQFNLWTVPSGGGFPAQKTSFRDKTVRAIAWSPDGKHILFTADEDGTEQHQLYVIDADYGWPNQLTHKMDAQFNISAGAWSPDGTRFAFAANDKTPRHMDVQLWDMETGKTTRIVEGSGLYVPIAWSPDGNQLTVVHFMSNVNQNIALLDVETGEMTTVTPHEGNIVYLAGPWQPDGSGFYFVSNEGQEFNNLAFYDIESGSWEWVETPDHDIDEVHISDDGTKLIWVENHDGASVLKGRHLETEQPLNLPQLPLGVISGSVLAPNSNKLALVFTTPQEATNLYEVDLSTGQMTSLGQSMLGGVAPADMVEPELVSFATWDERDIPGWLYRPQGEGVFPVILSIHGGPEAQERPTYAYSGMYQYLVSRGFGIFAPNIRGSTGYGISYQQLIHRDWGGGELRDIEHAAHYLKGLDWVDSNRVAIFGGSFGGFAVLSALSRLPELWAAGVDLVGPSNLITFVDSVPPFWKGFMKEWIGDAEEDRDFLIERSPITYVDHIRAPLLVIQGANDPRVVQAESDQMVERIRKNGQEVEYYVDPVEGHGATRVENRIKWFQMCIDFLEDHLLDEPAHD